MKRGMLVLAGLAGLSGCGGSGTTRDDRVVGASAWAGAPGTGYVFLRVLEEAATSTATSTATDTGEAIRVDRDRPLLLHALADRWEMRVGEPRWSRGTPYAVWEATRSGGFSLAGRRVIPGRPEVGAEEDGTRVVSVDTVQTWGGTFPEVLTVDVGAPHASDTGDATPADATGPAGIFQFARDLGPVALTLPDGRWELVRWETLPPEETATATDTATAR